MYKFDPRGDPVDVTFRAIALSQLDEALNELGSGDGRTLVHEARRRCKKLRGLLRLVRPAFADFAKENAAIRDAAALLSHLRDTEVLRHTIADLAAAHPGDALERIGQRLAAEDGAGDPAERLAQFRDRMGEVRERARGWSLSKAGPRTLNAGLKTTYRLARKDMRKAQRTRTPVAFHEWRKAVKYHGFHVDLLKRTAPVLLPGDIEIIDQLSEVLGQLHDLAVLRDAAERVPERFGIEDREALKAAVAEREDELEAQAFELGRQVLAERPRHLARRFARYWASS